MSPKKKAPKASAPVLDEKEQAKLDAFLQKDYELKIAYLTNHFGRMWTRFNYFVAIETALIGGKFLIPNGVLSPELAITGALISLVWYVMGAEDRYLVRIYRHQVEIAAEELAQAIWPDEEAQKAYRYIGEVDQRARAELRESESVDAQGRKKSAARRFFGFEWLSGWRWEPLSTTRLAALFPFLIFVLWIIILFSTLAQPARP
jgi:hypothetical protein